MAEQVVELSPGESKLVSFEATPHEAKTYQVSINGLTGSFKAVGMPPFTFSNVSASYGVCPSATAYWAPIFDCRVSNPANILVTHTLTFWIQGYSHTYGVWRDPRAIKTFNLSLEPGASYDYNYNGLAACWLPLMMHYTYYLWLEDELGNKSAKVTIYRP